MPLPMTVGPSRMAAADRARLHGSSAPRFAGVPTDRQFFVLREAYWDTGGIARAHDISRLLEDRHAGAVVSLETLLQRGEVFGFEWHDTLWVPMFQFDPLDLRTRVGVSQLLAELTEVFDGWTLATWFAQPNAWLAGQRPMDLLQTALPAALEAARADRFVASG